MQSNKLILNNTIVIIIDIQEKLVNMLEEKTIVSKAEIIARCAKILDIPTIVTEQYPKGLGSTIENIKNNLPVKTKYFEKNTFSICEDNEILNEINSLNNKQVIICGIEAHICVLQSALDLLTKGFDVFIVKDACASRHSDEYNLAINRLNQAGAVITSDEMVIFELLGSSKHPKFKELQVLIK